ncbi:SPOR domain-containing protein [Desulfovibrio inopinatus]|uniref:SPOR domain-containing protein n=1 Tax=Desulfovibrio inopinatus TaxID=102109 RepID=UPI000416FCE3|nr:SPOR domain-containing protein [Desulfovibrio inopinatus]
MGFAVRSFILGLLCIVCLSCAKNTPQQEGPSYEVTYQVGAFLNEESATTLTEKLQSAGFDTSIEQARVDDVVFYRVLVSHKGPILITYQAGAFTDLANAEKLRDDLQAKGMECSIESAVIDGVTYHRVYVQNQGGITEMIAKLKNMGLGEPLFRDMRSL